MDGSIALTVEERKVLLRAYRLGTDVRAARRAHVVLLRSDGWTWQDIQEILFCSTDLIAETVRCFASGGVAAGGPDATLSVWVYKRTNARPRRILLLVNPDIQTDVWATRRFTSAQGRMNT